MKKFEVFGSGCANCQKAVDNIKEVIKELDLDAEVVKVEDMNEMVERGIMLTPAVALDDEMQATGKVPTKKEIKGWL
ncbi:MAG TPA: thioredoxin family protein [Halanaerobiales bacterium]|nr:thioredoxin family protein [Halanaerobiales bacterium]